MALLYTISTQPFKELIKEKFNTEKIEGIQLGDGSQLTHQSFVDDSGLFIHATKENFNYIKEVIKSYERILGAFLNLSKSIVIPLYIKQQKLVWIIDSRCKNAYKIEEFTYLGIPIGYNIIPRKKTDSLRGKVR